MVATSFRISSIFALALLTASTASALSLYAQSEKPGAQGDERATAGAAERGTQLDLMLAPGAEHRFRVRRGELPPTGKPAAPDAKDPGAKEQKPAVPAGKEQAVAFELALAVERSDGADKAKTLTATVRGERSAPVVYEVLVDQNGAIQRMQRKAEGTDEGKTDGQKDAAGATAQSTIPEADVRKYLEFALGTGLHGRKLEKGTTYKIGPADAARAGVREAALPLDDGKKGGRLADVALQFQGVGAGTDGELARFSLLLPESPRGATSPAAGGKEGASEDEREGTPAGDAAYSLEDGLLARLTYRPRPEATSAATEPAPVDWLEIERVVAD